MTRSASANCTSAAFRSSTATQRTGKILADAHPESATTLVIAIPNAFEAGRIVKKARDANPRLAIVARAHSDAETSHLRELGADTVIMGERQIALEMIAEIERLPLPATS